MKKIPVYETPIKVSNLKILFIKDINQLKKINIIGDSIDGCYVEVLGEISFPEFEPIWGLKPTWGQLDAIKAYVLSELKKAELNRIAEVKERFPDAPKWSLRPSSKWKEYGFNFETIRLCD